MSSLDHRTYGRIAASLALVLALTLALAPVAAAAPPDKITFQGRLTNASGNPVDGSVSMVLRLYDAATDGTLLWTSSMLTVSVSGGLYGTALEGGTPALSSLAFDAPYWLSVQVGTDPEMTPRYALSAGPYAMQAKNADTLDGQHAISFALSGHTHPGMGDITDVLAGSGISVTNPAGPQPTVSIATGGVTNALIANATVFASIQDFLGGEQFAVTNGAPALQFVGGGRNTASFTPGSHRVTIYSEPYVSGDGLSLSGGNTFYIPTNGVTGAMILNNTIDPVDFNSATVYAGSGGDLGSALTLARSDHLHNGTYYTQAQGDARYVTLAGTQTISGAKTFSATVTAGTVSGSVGSDLNLTTLDNASGSPGNVALKAGDCSYFVNGGSVSIAAGNSLWYDGGSVLITAGNGSSLNGFQYGGNVTLRPGASWFPGIISLDGNVNVTGIVSGNGSGLTAVNADTVDGQHASAFAPVSLAFVQNGNTFGALAVLGTNDSNGLALRTGGAERMRIDTTGNVGIGLTNPTSRLDVNGTVKSSGGFISTLFQSPSALTMKAQDGSGGAIDIAGGYKATLGGNVTIRAGNYDIFGELGGNHADVFIRGGIIGGNIPATPGSITIEGAYQVLGSLGFGSNGGSVIVSAGSGDGDFLTPNGNILLLNGNVGVRTSSPGVALDVNGTVRAASFSGIGTALTLINASNLSSGTIPLACLSGITTTQLSATAGITDAQVNNNLTLIGGTVNGTPVGAVTPSTGVFTTLRATDASTGLTVDNNARISGLVRSGSETGTGQAPNLLGLVTRRINSSDLTKGAIVAISDSLQLVRDGSKGGFILASSAPVIQTVSGITVDQAGAVAGQYVEIPASDKIQFIDDKSNIVHMSISFGDTINLGHQTQVILSRTNGNVNWTGVVISTVNQ